MSIRPKITTLINFNRKQIKELAQERNVMKKVLFVIAILYSTLVVYATNVPQWNEFCPQGLENPKILTEQEIDAIAKRLADEQTKILYCKYDGKTAKILRGITILPALDCYCGNRIAKSNNKKLLYITNEKNAYWLDRKNQFENELKTCEGLSNDNKAMCYLKVRELEIQKNNNLEQNRLLERQNYSIQSIQTQLWLNNINK